MESRMLRKLLIKRIWLSVAAAGACLPTTIVCEVPNISISLDGYRYDDSAGSDDDDCCDDDCCGDFFFDWWWF
jgi:hypothetical protein